MGHEREKRKDLHLAGIWCTGLIPGQVSKSRFNIVFLRVIQWNYLLRKETHNSRIMLNLNGQISSRELC